MEPWRSLGYQRDSLGRYLRRQARAGQVLAAVADDEVVGVLVWQPGVLLGLFVALLAVRPSAAGRGVGRALMAKVERLAFPKRRWLWVSSDADNAVAARFYKKLGFGRAARLPDLVVDGHDEILWRKARPPALRARGVRRVSR